MQPIATDVTRSVVLCVCVLGTWMSCVKMGELIKMPFGGRTRVGLWNHILEGSQHLTGPFAAARGDESAIWAHG